MFLNEDQNQLIRALNVVSSGIPVRAAVFSRWDLSVPARLRGETFPSSPSEEHLPTKSRASLSDQLDLGTGSPSVKWPIPEKARTMALSWEPGKEKLQKEISS